MNPPLDAGGTREGAPRRTKVVFVGARGLPNVEGGAEKNLERIAPIIAKRFDVVAIVMKQYFSTSFFEGVRIVAVMAPAALKTDKLGYFMASVLTILREKPDIVHCQGLNAAFLLFLYKLLGAKVVVRYGSADYVNEKWGPLGRLGFRFCEYQLRLADRVIAVTPSLAARLAERGVTDNVTVVRNALDEAPTTTDDRILHDFGLKPNRYLLSVGRITWQKDYATLISAFDKVRRAAPEVEHLVIVGGDDGSGYEPKLRAMNVEGVVFTGRLPRSSIVPLYNKCRLYINSSLHEGLSNAILEAVSHGAPLVVSDIVENRDLPLDERCFFRAGDVENLVSRLLEASKQPECFRVSQELFETWDVIADRTMNIYDEIMKR